MANILTEDFVVKSIGAQYRLILESKIRNEVREIMEEELERVVKESVEQVIDSFYIQQHYSPVDRDTVVNVLVRKKDTPKPVPIVLPDSPWI